MVPKARVCGIGSRPGNIGPKGTRYLIVSLLKCKVGIIIMENNFICFSKRLTKLLVESF